MQRIVSLRRARRWGLRWHMNARYLIWAAVITLIRQSGFYFLQCVRESLNVRKQLLVLHAHSIQ
jgi:hypothetical protein